MKMRHCFAALVLSLGFGQATVAQYSPSPMYPPSQPQVFNVPVKYGNSEAKAGIPLAVDTTPTNESEESVGYVTKLRQGLYELSLQEAAKHHQGDGFKDAVKSSTLKFTKESASFFIASFAVQFESLIVDYSDNPSALSKHLESLKDPIAHLSFYLFMVANGYSVNLLQKGTTHMDPATKGRAMKRIGYLGMAAGSIVSGISSEVLTTIKECNKTIFYSKDDKQNPEKIGDAKQTCDAALKQWTLNKKAQEYIPQIISLVASSEIAEFAEIRGKQMIMWGPKQIAKYIASHPGTVLKFAGIQLVTTAVPGGFVIKSLAIVAKLGQFAAFTYANEKISPYIQKLATNTIKPIEFSFDAKALDESVAKAKDSKWLEARSLETVAKELGNVTDLMKEWRQKQLAKFYSAHGIWGENTLRVIEQTGTVYGFYKAYTDSLFSTLRAGHAIRTGKLPPETMINESYYPFRTLPLYGINYLEKLPDGYSSPQDLYLQNPAETESYQIATVHAEGVNLKAVLERNVFKGEDAKLLSEIVSAFSSNKLSSIGIAIAKLNQAVESKLRPNLSQTKKYSPEMIDLLLKTRSNLGNPTPILTPGMAFSYAYETNSLNTVSMQKLERPKGAGADSRMTTDYLWIQMVCGADSKFYANPWGLTPSFMPPKLVRFNLQVPDLCQGLVAPYRDADGKASSNIYSQSYRGNDGRIYNGINDLIYQNIRPDVLGDFTNDDNVSAFDTWWAKKVRTSTSELFRTFDADYVHVLAGLTENWHSEKTYLDRINQSLYLDKDVLENLSFELNIYATVLTELLEGRVAKSFREAPPRNMLVTKKQVEDAMFAQTRKVIPAAGLRDGDTSGFLLRLKTAADAEANAVAKEQLAQRWQAGLITAQSQKQDTGSLQTYAAHALELAKQARAKANAAKADATILKGRRVETVKAIADLVAATQARIDILRKMSVTTMPLTGQYVVNDFPQKTESKEALEKTREALKNLEELIQFLQPNLGPGQNEVISKATAGLQSVITDVGALTMAFYTTKYKLEDDYQDILDERKNSQKETVVVPGTKLFTPGGQ